MNHSGKFNKLHDMVMGTQVCSSSDTTENKLGLAPAPEVGMEGREAISGNEP